MACSNPPEETTGSEPTGTVSQEAAAPDGAPLLLAAEAELGVTFRHDAGAEGGMRFPEMMGGGVAVLDADGDSDLDLYFVSGARPNQLFLQETTGQFVDRTEASGLGDTGYGTGVAVGDVDNDGKQDLFLSNIGPDRLYRGLGDGRFEDVSADAGIGATGTEADDWSTSAAFCDVDRDGWLDLYVVRYVVYDPTVTCTDATGRREYCGPDSFEDRGDVLLRNRGDGTFVDITDSAGIEAAAGAGLGVVCEDLDDDGWVDIYVANDGDPNQLWVNQGATADGVRFVDEALILGTSVNAEGLQEAGMGVVAADFDNDADFDLFLTHLRDETNTLYRNLGQGTGFQDETRRAALGTASTPFTGFGTAPLDLDLDGDLDLVIANGRVKRAPPLTEDLDEPWRWFAEPNQVYENEGGIFRLLESEVAAFTTPIEIGRGLACGDLDQDGDLDLVLNNLEGPARLYLGQPDPEHHWLMVDAFDSRLNRRALGSRITVRGATGDQVRTIQSAMSYLSSSDPRAHFGLGREAEAVEVEVRWPDGLEERFGPIEVDQAVTLERGTGQ